MMKVPEEWKVPVREVVAGYADSAELGVVGYGGKLNIRPAYQREFVYNPQQRDEVIRTVRRGFPLNVMYWVRNSEGGFEMLDGQQRTLSICQYVNGDYSINHQTFANLTKEEQDAILNYKLTIYICEGDERERLDWFEVVNTVGEQLNEQERRNAQYTGTWLYEAKKFFSKTGCAAAAIGGDYINAIANRQGFLETALKWIADRDGGDILDYMSKHQHDTDAKDLCEYYQAVIEWVKKTFPVKRIKLMKGLPWGIYYNKHGNVERNAEELEKRIAQLLRDDEDINDITNQRGIYEYVLDGDERHLSIRKFSDKMARTAYERQKGNCKRCGKHFEIEEMQADHIKAWSKGGHTVASNCQMLCAKCNNLKSDK